MILVVFVRVKRSLTTQSSTILFQFAPYRLSLPERNYWGEDPCISTYRKVYVPPYPGELTPEFLLALKNFEFGMLFTSSQENFHSSPFITTCRV